MTTKASELYRNSDLVMEHFLNESIDLIDRTFGSDYSIKNPNLVAALAQIGANDFIETRRAVRAKNGVKHEVD